MSGKAAGRIELLQGTLDLIVLRALATMGPQHAYGLAARLEQVADHPFTLNQGTLYPALVRLEQEGGIRGTWQKTEHNRDAKYYRITRAGTRALGAETARWRRLVHLVDKLLMNEGRRHGRVQTAPPAAPQLPAARTGRTGARAGDGVTSVPA